MSSVWLSLSGHVQTDITNISTITQVPESGAVTTDFSPRSDGREVCMYKENFPF